MIQLQNVETTLMINFQTKALLADNGAIEVMLCHFAYVKKNNDGSLHIDLNMAEDYSDIKFLGIPIEQGYGAFKSFQASLLQLGIDFSKLVDAHVQAMNIQEIKSALIVEYNLF